MDLWEVGNTQSLVNSLHEFLEYQKHLQWFNEAENKHKDLLRQQRLGFVAKCIKEFDMAKKNGAIKWIGIFYGILLLMTNSYLR